MLRPGALPHDPEHQRAPPPLCDLHWAHRLQQLDKSNEVYPPLSPPGLWSLVAPAQVVTCILEDVVNRPARPTMGS